MSSTDPDDRLAELLLRWEEAWEQGNDVPAEQLAAESPDLVEPLRRQIVMLKKMAWMKGDSDAETDEGADTKGRPDPLTSKTLGGRYRIDAFLAEGGFGRVYRGYDPELDRPVAVKVAKATAETSPDLLQEARRVAKLRHPGIVPIHDVGRDEGVWFFVSDLIDGKNLADLNRKPTPAEAANIVAQVADALHYAHQQGFVHRDIKPSNILLDAQGRPQVTDFGIAVTTEEIADRRIPRSGTLPYMAPEQVTGEVQLIGPRTDVYALGVVLYELLTGRVPYQGRTPTAMKEQILFRSPVSPRTIDGTIPPDLEAICLRCLAKHPANRFGSAEELAKALRNRPKLRVRWRLMVAAVMAVAVMILAGRFLPTQWPEPVKPPPTLPSIRLSVSDLAAWQVHDPKKPIGELVEYDKVDECVRILGAVISNARLSKYDRYTLTFQYRRRTEAAWCNFVLQPELCDHVWKPIRDGASWSQRPPVRAARGTGGDQRRRDNAA
jgi:eukaryotic-like serine/threonine-protein kinase